MNVDTPGDPLTAGPVTYALTGAGGGFARTLLAQSLLLPGLHPAVLCDLDPGAVLALCAELGYDPATVTVVSDAAGLRTAHAAGHTAVVADTALLADAAYDILVEATGSPAAGFRAARQAIEGRHHVAMVSKEVDSVAGIALDRLARVHGVVYTPAAGDQPANLIEWYDRIRALGLEIVAIGKSGEYDLVYDPDSGEVRQLDQTLHAPGLGALLRLGDDVPATLAARARAVAPLKRAAAADYCEMAVVAAGTGFVPDREALHYPVARTAELADVYALREDGGVLGRAGVIDVFSVLRLPEEASFAGGVFAVVRTHDAVTWEVLAQKGHVVSRNGRYACLYLPYHLMGVETPLTLLAAVRDGVPTGASVPGRHAVLAGRAARDLPAGTVLAMGGHHHEIDGVAPVLLPAPEAPADTAPFYLAAHARLARDVPKGALITLADLDGHDPDLLAAWHAGADHASRTR
ncbi:homoserine dehydrogenase [Streptomyces corynorhini]|uniref:Homoserine dehydrogenase n=1 Tax=Streptomyces corynorhini TaxID=2282652 RepID=A0A370BB50_9ACTN|nr:homoserine dehydrogenase [Streptomyces corynorhini]RDG37404.1 homoserine dehydrogenase [Streptomyces corynorhini]